MLSAGVVDILPYCLSSVYLFYDPEYEFLNLGTLTALKEVPDVLAWSWASCFRCGTQIRLACLAVLKTMIVVTD